MTYEEALKIALSTNPLNAGNQNGEYVKLIINALEKQIPKKPIEDGYYDLPCVCPTCGCPDIEGIDASGTIQYPYCPCCGQAIAIDWSGNNV